MLVVMPLRILVERHPEMGDSPEVLHMGLEGAFGSVRFATALAPLARRALPSYWMLFGAGNQTSCCNVDDAEWMHLRAGGRQGTIETPLLGNVRRAMFCSLGRA